MSAVRTAPLSGSRRESGRLADRIGPEDPRYADLQRRNFNQRFTGRPDYMRLVHSTEEVVDAVAEAVREKLRVVVRSGGHCMEGFVADPAVQVVLDTSLMTGVSYDPERSAFAVEAGTTVGEVYRQLFLSWGVTLPAGLFPGIGMGGHVLGGAFGYQCREHGLASDHLYGVEVVVVGEDGSARSVIATREPSDPNRDLWWAHTGGGGGNFGIVIRYWLKSPGTQGMAPASQLPRAPESVSVFRVAWSWEDFDEAAFTRLARNFCTWCEENSDASSPFAQLYSTLTLRRRQYGKIELSGVSTAGAEAERLFREHLAAVDEGVGVPHTLAVETLPWLAFVLNPAPEAFRTGGTALYKVKDAFLRKRFTEGQLAIAYDWLTRTDHDAPGGSLGLVTYGGRVNTVAPEATATAQRDSILTTTCSSGWLDPGVEAQNLAWVRGFYRDLYRETGGVPVPGEITDGAMINHPDIDLADPRWNTSGVPWYTLYYKDNYPRLQQVKARFDPRNVFRHALSIQPA